MWDWGHVSIFSLILDSMICRCEQWLMSSSLNARSSSNSGSTMRLYLRPAKEVVSHAPHCSGKLPSPKPANLMAVSSELSVSCPMFSTSFLMVISKSFEGIAIFGKTIMVSFPSMPIMSSISYPPDGCGTSTALASNDFTLEARPATLDRTILTVSTLDCGWLLLVWDFNDSNLFLIRVLKAPVFSPG